MPYELFLPLVVGVLSGLHCMGMCGGIMGALALSLPQRVREHKVLLLGYVAAQNGGRVASYALVGTVAGLFGQTVVNQISPTTGRLLLQSVAATVMVLTGLYLAGWFPQLGHLERLGTPLWRRLQGRASALMQEQTPGRAALFGLVWGWFPCGLVYAVLPLAAAAADPWRGALTLTAFGLGTLPITLATGLLAGRLLALRQTPFLRQLAGVALIALALASPFLPTNHHPSLVPGGEPGAGTDPALHTLPHKECKTTP